MYNIWDLVVRNIITSRDVVFDEKLNVENTSVSDEKEYYSLLPLLNDEPIGPLRFFFVVVCNCLGLLSHNFLHALACACTGRSNARKPTSC